MDEAVLAVSLLGAQLAIGDERLCHWLAESGLVESYDEESGEAGDVTSKGFAVMALLFEACDPETQEMLDFTPSPRA